MNEQEKAKLIADVDQSWSNVDRMLFDCDDDQHVRLSQFLFEGKGALGSDNIPLIAALARTALLETILRSVSRNEEDK